MKDTDYCSGKYMTYHSGLSLNLTDIESNFTVTDTYTYSHTYDDDESFSYTSTYNYGYETWGGYSAPGKSPMVASP